MIVRRYSRAITAMVLLLVPLVTQASTQLDAARTAFDDLRFADAQNILQAYEEAHGDSAQSLYLRTRIAVVRGQLDQGKSLAERCRDAFSDNSLCYEASGETDLIRLILEGGILSKIGSARRAKKSLQRAVELDPENLRARLLLVRYYVLAPWILGGSKSKAREQVAACRTRSAAWGHEAQALYDLGVGNTRKAVEGFARAQALLPHERDPALFLAKAYVADEQPDAAMDTLELLVEKYPKFQEAWLEIGKIAAQTGKRSIRGMAALERFISEGRMNPLNAWYPRALR